MLTESQQFEVRRLKRKTTISQIARRIGATELEVREYLATIRERQYYPVQPDPTPEEIAERARMIRNKNLDEKAKAPSPKEEFVSIRHYIVVPEGLK